MSFTEFKQQLQDCGLTKTEANSHESELGFWYGAPDRVLSIGYSLAESVWTVSTTDAKVEGETLTNLIEKV